MMTKVDVIKQGGVNNSASRHHHRLRARPRTRIPKEKLNVPRVLLALSASLSGVLQGYALCGAGIIFATSLRKHLSVTYDTEQKIIGIGCATAAVFAFLSSGLNDMLGRKKVILMSSVFSIIGGGICMKEDKDYLMAGRAIIGCGMGLSSATVPMYIAECSSANHRGALTVIFELCVAFGSLLSAVVCILSVSTVNITIIFQSLYILVAVIQFSCMIVMPESPRWLVLRGNLADGHRVLEWLQTNDEGVPETIKEIVRETENRKVDADEWTIIHIWRNISTRRALIIACFLQTTKGLSNIMLILVYGTRGFMVFGESMKNSLYLMLVLYVVKFLVLFVPLVAVEVIGRRKLLLVSTLSTFISFSIFIAYLATAQLTTIEKDKDMIAKLFRGVEKSYCNLNCANCLMTDKCGFCYKTLKAGAGTMKIAGQCLQSQSLFTKVSLHGPCMDSVVMNKNHFKWTQSFCPGYFQYTRLLVYIVVTLISSYSLGFSPLVWTVNTEAFPTWARSSGMAFSTMLYWAITAVLTMTYYTLHGSMRSQSLAMVSFASSVIVFLFLKGALPEFKGRRLESAEKLMRSKWNYFQFEI